jgi:outer membrane protein OmpA-like peptidoglycan-associated protein
MQLFRFCFNGLIVILLIINIVSAQTNLPRNLGAAVNTNAAELNPQISADGKTLFFTRQDHPENLGLPSMQDIWISTLGSGGKWTKAINPGPPLNNASHNSVFAISPDGNTLLLMGEYAPDGTMKVGISTSYKTATGWSNPEPVRIRDYYNLNEFVCFYLAAGDQHLLMAVERKEGEGKLDLYVSFKEEDGVWSVPKSLGKTINTPEHEGYPCLASDMKTLYFCSRGHQGFGGFDIWMSRRLDETWTNWSVPKNLGPVINTADNELSLSITAEGKNAYLISSARSLGSTDIFDFELPPDLRPYPVALVTGKVIDANTNKPINDAKVVYEILSIEKEVGLSRINPKDGSFQIALPAGNNYGFRAEANNYYPISENLDLSKLNEYKTFNVDLKLKPLRVGEAVRINNVFFESAKWDLKPESFSELDRLVKLLKRENYNIEIAGHTDSIGTDKYNVDLSRHRAKAVADYLIRKGIPTGRISFVGYGKTKPVKSNATAEGRKENRRVEFILKEPGK